MAYHKIIITILWLSQSILEILAILATEQQEISYIQIHSQTSTSFYSNNDPKQGNVLATLLYSRAFDMTLQQAKCNLIAVILNKSHTVLAYTDSIVTSGQSKAHLEKAFNKIGTESKKNLVSQQTTRKPK